MTGPAFLLTKKDGEFLRVLASILVVVAHCVHVWVEGFCAHREFFSLSFLSAVLDQLTRFTVPLFFFLSGFGLTLQLRDKPLRLREYYRYRLSKILAPFLIWSLLTAFRHQEFKDLKVCLAQAGNHFAPVETRYSSVRNQQDTSRLELV